MKYLICRLWHGWTTSENADDYEVLLKKEILPHIHEIKGYRGSQLLRRELKEKSEVEFITITYFDSLVSVIDFAGDDYTRAVVPDEARRILVRFDEFSAHYNLEYNDLDH